MAKLTIAVGLILIAIGAAGFVATGSAHPTALIPAYIGLVLAVSGILANTENPKRRMLWMHIAVTVGLLGFLGTVVGLIDTVKLFAGTVLPHPIAVEEKGATSIVCLIFVALCVRSFISARRNRVAA